MRKITSKGGRGGSGSHALYQRVKKRAGTIKASSRRWLERHLNDPYVHQSKVDGYRSRSAYKLIEIDERYKIFKKGQKIIDLGAAPGGWCQVAAHKVESSDQKPSVVGIDYLPMDPLPGVVVLEMDFLHENAPQKLMNALGEQPDIVLSDMAAPTTGHRQTDHLRTVYLCEMAADFALSFLKSGGHFLAKAFQGGAENILLTKLKQNFKTVHHVKPPASRAESVELYLLALEFKGITET
ncbi:cell division protein ftsJ [Bartonella clarridgeiae 73]|uniref:Ribosomal RNA large subunit methyltransferase E n=1 Tax=Bartonella clarridgeiae (strain CCUG 45776 / CIP 104772 / 73) TaxID=696125 RepID=E6YIV7_BARC7|nr:RlmE family RNA methyltransferase [Bartonella clarridgeiae]WCR54640.1 MAG: 23S rRNA (uridine(2552)-2'-O)-methyltransferase [Bartonella clarridgeiae]CBI76795.1 cell division protein ftsJ [Bartonella clarridgeiae 73]